LFDRAAKFFQSLQTDICRELATVDGAKEFGADAWQRPGGGGGVARVLEGGALFEKAGVNWSNVDGELPAELAEHMPGTGTSFRASGVSLVLHPHSPMIPTTHANFRCIQKGDVVWFGGGADLTPYYVFREDAIHFHETLADVCDQHAPISDYNRFKTWCDEYFFLPHRSETRGVGGVFFDYLGSKGEHPAEDIFAFVQDLGRAFTKAYVPIARRCRMARRSGRGNWFAAVATSSST
jgi:coproporphyrinogen III oxidase